MIIIMWTDNFFLITILLFYFLCNITFKQPTNKQTKIVHFYFTDLRIKSKL